VIQHICASYYGLTCEEIVKVDTEETQNQVSIRNGVENFFKVYHDAQESTEEFFSANDKAVLNLIDPLLAPIENGSKKLLLISRIVEKIP
jgi:hypothetical protein